MRRCASCTLRWHASTYPSCPTWRHASRAVPASPPAREAMAMMVVVGVDTCPVWHAHAPEQLIFRPCNHTPKPPKIRTVFVFIFHPNGPPISVQSGTLDDMHGHVVVPIANVSWCMVGARVQERLFQRGVRRRRACRQLVARVASRTDINRVTEAESLYRVKRNSHCNVDKLDVVVVCIAVKYLETPDITGGYALGTYTGNVETYKTCQACEYL